MRPVRPTVRVLKSLPSHMFADPTARARRDRGDRSLLQELDRLDHWIVNAARAAIYEGHQCQLHDSSTASAGQRVFEIREKSSGWRGAVILDAAGDPWLVHVDSHQQFHRQAKDVLTEGKRAVWYPGAADYRMRDLEEHAAAGERWKGDVAQCLLDSLSAALVEATAESVQLPHLPGSPKEHQAVLRVALEHDPIGADVGVESAHLSDSMATITVRVTGDTKGVFLDMFMTVLIALLGHNPDLGVPGYLPGGRGWVYIVTMSKADLIQLLDLQRSGHDETPWTSPPAAPRTHKHFIRDQFMMSALVNGHAVRSVCGVWFVPAQDGEGATALPVCPRCDHGKPLAQAVLDIIRSRAELN